MIGVVLMRKLMKKLFDDEQFFKILSKLAIPIIIQNFIASFLNMIDTIMVGRLGEAEIAAVGIANQYFFLFNLLVIGVYSGSGIFISQFWGKKDHKNIRKVLSLVLIIGVFISLFLTVFALIIPDKIIGLFNKDPKVIMLGSQYLRIICLSYVFTAITFGFGISLRCIGKAVTPMIISAIALITNTILNYAFIFGHFGSPHLGVKGAALATVIARIVELVILIIYVYKSKSILAINLSDLLDLNRKFVNRVFRTSTHVVLNEACWGIGTIVYSMVYGRIGTKAMASVQICTTIQNIFMVITFGISSAAAVMIGNEIGADNKENGKVYARRFSLLGVGIGIVIGSILALSAPKILTLFNISDEVYHSSLIILYVTSLIMIVRVFNIILITGILRGGGDAKYALKVEAVTMWMIGVPLSIIGAFVFKFPVYIVVGLSTFEEIVKCIAGISRLVSNKWINNVVHNM